MPKEVVAQLFSNKELDIDFLDFYCNFLRHQNSNVLTFPALWVTEFLLETKYKDLKSSKGFAFTKKMEMPWKYSVLESQRELIVKYKYNIASWKVYKSIFIKCEHGTGLWLFCAIFRS